MSQPSSDSPARDTGNLLNSEAQPASSSPRIVAIGLATVGLYLLMQNSQRAISLGTRPVLHLALYWATIVVLFMLYVRLLVSYVKLRPRTAILRGLVLGVPLLINCMLLVSPPALSIDSFSYISHGYLAAELHRNPYAEPSSLVAATPLGQELEDYGWRPVHPVTPYGPLWTHAETIVVRFVSDVSAELILLKTVAVVCSLGSAWMIWLILGRVAPQNRWFGVIAYLWNPLIIAEFAGEGHNDSVMIFFTLLGLFLTLVRRSATGTLALSLGVLTKYLPLMIVPLKAAYEWRVLRPDRYLVLRWCSSVFVAATLAALLFAPFWIGSQTFAGIQLTGRPGHTGSTQTVIVEALSRIAPGWNAETTVLFVALGVFVAFLGLQTLTVVDTDSFLKACAWTAVAYVLFAAPSFWPWYATLPVALLALNPRQTSLWILVALSLGARLVAPLDQLYVHEIIGRPTYFLSVWLGGVALPLTILAMLFFKNRTRRRYSFARVRASDKA